MPDVEKGFGILGFGLAASGLANFVEGLLQVPGDPAPKRRIVFRGGASKGYRAVGPRFFRFFSGRRPRRLLWSSLAVGRPDDSKRIRLVTAPSLQRSDGGWGDEGEGRIGGLLGRSICPFCELMMRPMRPTWFPCVGLFAA